MSNTWKIVEVNGDWEQLVSPTGEVVAENHRLDAEDIFWALGVPVEFDYVITEED